MEDNGTNVATMIPYRKFKEKIRIVKEMREEGNTYKEIAEKLGRNAKGVSQRLYRYEGEIRYGYRDWETDRKSTRLNSSHSAKYRMPSSA